MNWLVLRDVMNTACNVMSAAYKRVGGLTMPVDTADLVVYTVGQTDGHSNSDHTMSRADIERGSLGPQANLLMLPMAPQGLYWSYMA